MVGDDRVVVIFVQPTTAAIPAVFVQPPLASRQRFHQILWSHQLS